jgi:hypothetical protein
MSAEENKAAFRRIPEEVFNSGNLELTDELFASDYIEHTPVPPGWPSGLEGFKMFATTLRSAFPDVHYTVGPSSPKQRWPPAASRRAVHTEASSWASLLPAER